ncbi:MAG: HEAT repeat domain-containing protein [Spirochaetaceae bacterium]|jgi:HEAT repeat protein|nr:HEAT repeat domain-containing protein [Spirochaetaceae bacterium]
MKNKILLLVISINLLTPLFGDIVSTPLGNKLRTIFPELKNGYIDLNKNGSLDRLEDMDEQISDFLVQDDQLQVQETLEFIRINYRYFPVRELETVRDALNSPEGTINELIGLNYGASISQLIEKRLAMGEYGLYLPPSARKKAMDELAGYLALMDSAYKKEGSGAEQDFTNAKNSLYEMLEKGYPIPEPLSTKEKEILESTLINTLIREQKNDKSVNTALYSLGILRSGRGIPYIIPLVSNDRFAIESIRSLGAIGNLEALDLLLLKLEENPEENIQIEIIRALGSMGSRESLEPLFNILKTEDLSDNVQRAVLESLGKIAARGTADRRISATLTEYLNSADPSMRIIAVNGLSAFSDQGTVNSLLGLFRNERSENVLLSLVDRAQYIDNPSIVPSLIGLLQNPQTSIELQKSCLFTIGSHSEGIKGIYGVLTALSSPVKEIRDAAYNASKALYETDNSALIGGLARMTNSNEDVKFQQQAAKLFSELPDPASVLSLLNMIISPDPEVKRYVTLALYRIRPEGNVRITTALNKIVSNETEPLDVRINAVRALGAAGYDNPTIKVEQTLTTAATMRDEKYAQLRYFAIRALGQMNTLSEESIDKIINIAARERDSSIRTEAVKTLSLLGISNPQKMKKISNSLDKLDLKNNTTLALLFCEILGESRSTEFISTGKELSAYLTDNSSLRRLTYAFYLTGSEEGYESMIRMGKTPDLVNFITSLVESSDKMILGRVLESLKRSESDVQILDLIDIIESEVLFY